MLYKNKKRKPLLKPLGYITGATHCTGLVEDQQAFCVHISDFEGNTSHTIAISDSHQLDYLSILFRFGAKRLFGIQRFNTPDLMFTENNHEGGTWLVNGIVKNWDMGNKQNVYGLLRQCSPYDIALLLSELPLLLNKDLVEFVLKSLKEIEKC